MIPRVLTLLNRPVRLPFLLGLALSLTPVARSQQVQLDSLAAALVLKLEHSKVKSVAVFGFAESTSNDPRLRPLAIALADDLSAVLAAPGNKLRILDRSVVKTRMENEGLEPNNLIRDKGVAGWMAHKLGAEGVVVGDISADGETIKLRVVAVAYGAEASKQIADLRVVIPVTDAVRKMISDTTVSTSPMPFDYRSNTCLPLESIPCGGTQGYSTASCSHCPEAVFTDEATQARAGGIVLLMVVVDENGYARDIRAVRAVPFGLTMRAIQTVKQWKFSPSIGPDGRPAAVRMPIQINFEMLLP